MKHFVSYRLFIFTVPLVLSTLFQSVATYGTLLVDDFSEVSDPGLYPIVKTYPTTSPIVVDEPVLSTVGGLRLLTVAPGPTIPPPNPIPPGITLTVDIDTTEGKLSSVASADSTTFLFLAWASNTSTPMSVDISGEMDLVIDYGNANADFQVEVTLSNLDDSDPNTVTGANQGQYTLASTAAGQLRVPLSSINIPVNNVLGGGTFPAIDLTSVDAVSILFESSETGSSLDISRVEFIPEPSSACLLVLCMGLISARRLRK